MAGAIRAVGVEAEEVFEEGKGERKGVCKDYRVHMVDVEGNRSCGGNFCGSRGAVEGLEGVSVGCKVLEKIERAGGLRDKRIVDEAESDVRGELWDEDVETPVPCE